MKTYRHGDKACYGIYVAPGALDIRLVGADCNKLDGLPSARYHRLPTLLALAAAPAIGGAFVLTFPLIVVFVALFEAGRAVRRRLSGAAARYAHLAVNRWEPATAYLNRKEKDLETADDEGARAGERDSSA